MLYKKTKSKFSYYDSINNKGEVYDINNAKLDIKPKYWLYSIPETGHGAFLDEDNYLYVSTYNGENMKKEKVLKAYRNNDTNDIDILVKFEDGTLKKLSDYENW